MCWVYCKILKLYLFWFRFFLSVTGTHTSSKNQQNINLNLHLEPQNCWRIFSWHDVWHWICTVTWFLLLFFLPFLLIYFLLLLLLLQLFQDVFDPFWKFLWKMSFSTNTHNFFLECWVTTVVAQWIMEALKFLSSYLGNCVNYTSAFFPYVVASIAVVVVVVVVIIIMVVVVDVVRGMSWVALVRRTSLTLARSLQARNRRIMHPYTYIRLYCCDVVLPSFVNSSLYLHGNMQFTFAFVHM